MNTIKQIGQTSSVISIDTHKEHRTTRLGTQENFIGERDIFGLGGLHIKNGIENSDYITDMIHDAMSSPEIITSCLGKDICNEQIQEKFMSLKSDKLPYDPAVKKSLIKQKIASLAEDQKSEFFETILKKISELEKKYKSLSRKKSMSTEDIKEARKEISSTRRKQKNKYTRLLDQIDQRIPSNKKISEQYKQKIDIITKEKEAAFAALPIANESSSNLEQERKQVRKEIEELQTIIDGKDKTSKIYKQLHKKRKEKFTYQATKTIEKNMYSEKEQQFQENIRSRIQHSNEKYTLPNNNLKAYSKEHLETIDNTKSYIRSTKFIVEDYFITYISELLQIQLLEKTLKEMYPKKNIAIYKAPTIDDMKAKTDCFIKVDNDYIAIDLKTSINKKFLKDQIEKIEEAKPLYATSHALNIEPTDIRNNILAVHPSKTYTLLTGLMKHLYENSDLPNDITSLEDKHTYENIHKAVIREHNNNNKDTMDTITKDFSGDIKNIIENKAA